MRKLVLNSGRLALGVAATVLLAGCGSGDTDTATDLGDGRLVSVASVDETDVLVDSDGRTLYTADIKEDGSIRCVDGCESFWVPLEADRSEIDALGSSLADDLGVVERPDGTSQLTFDGVPLYTFSKDDVGELMGDGFTDDFQGTRFVWTAARVDDSVAPPSTPDESADPATEVGLEGGRVRRGAAGRDGRRGRVRRLGVRAPVPGAGLRPRADHRGLPALAEDVAQESFVKAWRHAATYDPRRGRVATWLLTITRNTAIDAVRYRHDSPMDPDLLVGLLTLPDEGHPGGDPDEDLGLREALAELPPEQSGPIVLMTYLGMTAREIASRDDLPLGTVKSRVRRGLLQLRRRWECTMAESERCAEVRDLIPELAAGVASGESRARAVAHLAGCADCRRELEEVAGVVDGMLQLAPEREPPNGFEARVLAAIRPRRARPRLRTAWRSPPASSSPRASPPGSRGGGARRTGTSPTTTAGSCPWQTELFPRGRPRGRRCPPWARLRLRGSAVVAVRDCGGRPSGSYHVRLVDADGRSAWIGVCTVRNGTGSWGTTVDVPIRDVVHVQMTGDHLPTLEADLGS